MKKLLPFIILGLLAILAVLVEVYLPKPLNWHETFEKKDKNPYGSFILVDFLKDIFPNRKITITEKTPYQVLDYYDYSEETFRYQLDSIATAPANGSSEKQYATSPDSIISQDSLNRNNDSIAKTNLANMEEDLQNSRIIPDIQRPKDSVVLEKENYVFINSEFSPGETDAHALLNFAKTGNSVFIAAQEMQGVLADSLKIKIGNGLYDMNFSTNDLAIDQKKDSIYLTLLNTKLKTFEKKYYYRNGTVPGYFSSIDTANTQVLGLNSDGKATFICIKYGEGFFFISSTPLAYTNYNMMLADNSEYISASLSYLPV
ncbi:MAG TPA: hypothetical protein VK766_07385, partial [Cytophagaceae bacterium]|nr:hypothetical protein [Cytophagaceae bacterium]